MKKNIKIIMSIIGTLIGAGFASGREMYEFFFRFGKFGILGIVISAIITLVYLMLPLFLSFGNGALSYLSLIDFYKKFPSGVLSAKEIIGLISFTIMCLGLVVMVIKRRKSYR